MKKTINAQIVADSINQMGDRITTYLLTYPRFIHAELMTHRMFSRNSASSRAIPFEKMVKMVEEDPFIPIAWQKDHKGMQGTEYWTDDDTVTVDKGDEYERYTKIYSATEHFITEWLEARDLAIAQSYELNRLGLTKQLCNRLLEPFMWHTVLVTATEWDNFFNLRCPKYRNLDSQLIYKSKKDFLIKECLDFSPYKAEGWYSINESQAEIHIQALAESMWDAMNESTPKQLKTGEWHIPFGDKIDDRELAFAENLEINEETDNELTRRLSRQKISTARCARLSYMTFDGEIDYKKDIKLHDKLLLDRHMSPFEHCARAMVPDEYFNFHKGDYRYKYTDEEQYKKSFGWCNNFKGFIPYRYMIENHINI